MRSVYGGTVLLSSFPNQSGANEQVEEIWAARVYTVVPERNPEEIFFAYSTVEGENLWRTWLPKRDCRDTYQLDRLKSLLERNCRGNRVGSILHLFSAPPFQENRGTLLFPRSGWRWTSPLKIWMIAVNCCPSQYRNFVDETGLTPSEDFVNNPLSFCDTGKRNGRTIVFAACVLDWNDAISGPLDYRAEKHPQTPCSMR